VLLVKVMVFPNVLHPSSVPSSKEYRAFMGGTGVGVGVEVGIGVALGGAGVGVVPGFWLVAATVGEVTTVVALLLLAVGVCLVTEVVRVFPAVARGEFTCVSVL
jgi:hypothetical protein